MKGRDIILFVLFLIVIILGVTLILPSYRERKEKVEELADLQKEQRMMENELRRLEETKEKLEKKDSHTMSMIARDEGKLVRPGDKVYHFPPEESREEEEK